MSRPRRPVHPAALSLGETLRGWRTEANLTLEEACVAARVSYPFLRNLEHGRRRSAPPLAALSRLAETYRRDVRELFTDDLLDALRSNS